MFKLSIKHRTKREMNSRTEMNASDSLARRTTRAAIWLGGSRVWTQIMNLTITGTGIIICAGSVRTSAGVAADVRRLGFSDEVADSFKTLSSSVSTFS